MAEMHLRPQIEDYSDSDIEDTTASQSTSSKGGSLNVSLQNSIVADTSSSFGPIITSSPKRCFDDADDMIIVEDLLQFLIAKVAGAPIKTEKDLLDDYETDSGIIIISDDE